MFGGCSDIVPVTQALPIQLIPERANLTGVVHHDGDCTDANVQAQLPVCKPCTNILHLTLSVASSIAKDDEPASRPAARQFQQPGFTIVQLMRCFNAYIGGTDSGVRFRKQEIELISYSNMAEVHPCWSRWWFRP